MNPSIGRIVHFVQNKVHYAAMVVKVWTPLCVNLYVFPNGSDYLVPGVTDGGQSPFHQQDARAGVTASVPWAPAAEDREFSWHWPEREEV